MTSGAAIYGAGGHGKVVASILRARRTPILGFFDDAYSAGETIHDLPVWGGLKDIDQHRDRITSVYLALGDNARRSEIFTVLRQGGFELPPLIHPWALVESDTVIADGCVICMGAMVATAASLGTACIMNTGSTLDHESSLGDLVHLSPRAAVAGRTTIGSRSFLGMGAVVAQGLTIGSGVVIGANSVVLGHVPEGSRVLGVYR